MDIWDQIKQAVNSIIDSELSGGTVKRVDGGGWTVYAVGSNIIRIDVKR